MMIIKVRRNSIKKRIINQYPYNFQFVSFFHKFPLSSVKNFVSQVKNGSFLVRIKIWKFLSKRSIYKPVAKEQIRQIIADNNLNSVADVYTLLRDGFKDILQELMEAELDAALGSNEKAGLNALADIRDKWGKKYPYAVSSWENNWEDVSAFFQFPDEVRRIMYTTNVTEGLNRQYRKVTKTKSVFPSDSSLEKMLYLASQNAAKKWSQRYRNWDQVLSQLIVLYGERLTQYLQKRKAWGRALWKVPLSQTYSVGIYSIAGKPNLIPEAGCGQSPRKRAVRMLYFSSKKVDISV